MRKSLQAFLWLLGVVACGAGLLTVLTGAVTIVGANEASPSLDSELRFYAAWYVVAGVFILRAARLPEAHRVVIVAVGRVRPCRDRPGAVVDRARPAQ